MLKKAHDVVTRASLGPDIDQQELEKNRFSKSTRQCRHTFSAIEKVNNYNRGLKKTICEKMLVKLQHMAPDVHSNLIRIRHFETAKGRFRCALIYHAQQEQTMKIRINKKKLPAFPLRDHQNVPSTGCPKKT